MRKTIRITVLAIMAVMMLSIACYADMTGENGKTIPSVKVRIPVKHEISGNYSGKDTFSFTLKAEDPKNPMPKGAENGKKTVTVKGNGVVDFGEITFEYPDAYRYEITRTAKKTGSVKMEDKSYTVMIAMYNNGTAQMVTWDKATSEKTDEILFKDKAIEKSRSPKTGDQAGTLILAALLMAAALVSVIIYTAKKRKEDKVHEE